MRTLYKIEFSHKKDFFANNVEFFDALDKFYKLTIDYNADKRFKDFIGTEWL